MSKLPDKCVIDTNVAVLANLATRPDLVEDALVKPVLACVTAIEHIVKQGLVVLDEGGEIFDEYLKYLRLKGQPGVGDRFVRWLHDNRWGFPAEDRVKLTPEGVSYAEFPNDEELKDFDNADRKFVATANKHAEKPPILQGTDSKWWGWKDALLKSGVTVHFLCPDYVELKYKEKFKQQ